MAKNIQIKKIAQFKGHSAAIYDMALAADGTGFYSCGGDGNIVWWNFEEPDNGLVKIKGPKNLFALCVSRTTSWILVGDMNGGVHWLHTQDTTKNKHIAHHKKGTYGILEHNGFFYTSGGDGMLTKWNEQGQSIESIQLSLKALRRMDILGDQLIVGASDGNIYKIDVSLFSSFERIERAHLPSVFTVKWFNGSILSGGRDAYLKCWDSDSFSMQKGIAAHNFTVNSLAVNHTGQWIATGSRDKTIKIWDAQSLALVKVIEGFRDSGHFASVNKVLWLPDKNFLLSCGDDRTIIYWELKEV